VPGGGGAGARVRSRPMGGAPIDSDPAAARAGNAGDYLNRGGEGPPMRGPWPVARGRGRGRGRGKERGHVGGPEGKRSGPA
jgi:hypothetical protein